MPGLGHVHGCCRSKWHSGFGVSLITTFTEALMPHTHTRTSTYTWAKTYTQAHTPMHSHTPTEAHTRANIRKYTNICTHTQSTFTSRCKWYTNVRSVVDLQLGGNRCVLFWARCMMGKFILENRWFQFQLLGTRLRCWQSKRQVSSVVNIHWKRELWWYMVCRVYASKFDAFQTMNFHVSFLFIYFFKE